MERRLTDKELAYLQLYETFKGHDLARRVGCHESWIARLDAGGYHGPAAQEWREKYSAALDDLIAKKKAARR
jgi:hypothetical protein